MKKLIAILLVAAMSLSLVACGGSSSDSGAEEAKTEEKENTEAAEEEKEESSEEVAEDDGVIDFECDTFKVTYTRHEVSTDWEGNPCLVYYYNFTNKADEATNAMVAAYLQCFQNGVECETTFLDSDNAEYMNASKDVQKDITIECCSIFKLSDTSEVTIESSDWTSLSDDKDVQKITLE